MKRDPQAASAPIYIPGVVTLAASSRRTLKHGDTFGMFDEFGDVVEVERSPMGLFHHDTRFLSRLLVTLEGHRPLVLGSTLQPDNVLLDVDLTNPDVFERGELVLAKDNFHVARAKFLWGASCYELFTISNFAERRARLRLALEFGADFADIFEVRGLPRARRGEIRSERRSPAEAAFVYASLDGVPRATRVCFAPAPERLELEATAGRAEFELELGVRQRRVVGLTVHCVHGDEASQPETRYFTTLRRARRTRVAERERSAAVESPNVLFNSIVSRSAADLAMLTAQTPQGPYPYAGVPWFSTAFGRDGLIAAMETLWLDPALARGVLRFLAFHQAKEESARADAEPGKILHEVRECELAHLGAVPFGRYYGSVDSTPLFVALAGMYWERTRDRETLEAIWPNVRAGLEWIQRYGDRDGDGFVEYGRRSTAGLRNQGWKDSEDAVFHADGRIAEPSIALCEVQGYVHLALRLASRLAHDLGEQALATDLSLKAQQLQRRFESAFWCGELGTYALALDGDKEPCKVRASNAGQLLFTGICAPERAARVARGLMERDFFTGWGLRTLSSREKRFNPASYHNGSVWPHDNALIALGLARSGHKQGALALTSSMFDAAAHMHLRRLPELFCGFERRREKSPTPYPVACAPQAWAACAPFLLLQACLGIEIDAGASKVVLRRPRLPAFLDWLEVKRLQVGEAKLHLMFRRHDGGSVAVTLVSREGEAEVEVVL